MKQFWRIGIVKNTIIKIFLIVTLCLVFNCQPAQAISETNGVNKESIESIEKLAESGDLLAQEFLSEFYSRYKRI